jgi:hypothetical protein
MGKHTAMGALNYHRWGIVDTRINRRGDACGRHGRVVHARAIPQHMFGHLCSRMQQRTRTHLWHIHRGYECSKRILRRAARLDGNTSYPTQCQQTSQPTVRERGNSIGLPGRPETGNIPPIAQDPITMPSLQYP